MKPTFWKLFAITLFCLGTFISNAKSVIDLRQAPVILFKIPDKELLRTVTILKEEVARRSQISLKTSTSMASSSKAQIILLLESSVSALPGVDQKSLVDLQLAKEGYAIITVQEKVFIVGKDARGLLYGVGKFLRKAEMKPQSFQIARDLRIVTSPQFAVRGHQLGYRAKTNSYDAFSVEQFDQYIRDLAIFGANSIEILPPRTDDKPSSIHMKIPPMQMVKEQSRIAASYGMDVWMWYPNLEKDYKDAATISKELQEREEVFRQVSKINHLFAPGGDPGHLHPDELFDWVEKVANSLQKYHPTAKIWLSPQSFQPDKKWFNDFFRRVNEKPDWLGGLVFGPWVKLTMSEIKTAMKVDLPIRNYPDISHMMASQYPTPHWDPVWAATLGREPIIPRPVDQKIFHNSLANDVIGSISYSEGVSDDVNKFIWSDQDWSTSTSIYETMQDYARYFFGPEWAYVASEGLFALERNQKGEVATNTQIEASLMLWKSIEQKASPQLLNNFRFQMALLRAYYDAYIKERLTYENELERRSVALLHNTALPVVERIQRAQSELEKAWKEPIRGDLKTKCLVLADQLFESIGSQLTIQKHGAASGRGNFIDFIDYPLNDSPWLLGQLKRISLLQTPKEKEQEIEHLLNRKNPGIGGFYDHFGNVSSWHRVIHYATWEQDPGSLTTPRIGHTVNVDREKWTMEIPSIPVPVLTTPKEWASQVEAIYGVPLRIKYEHLDPNYTYKMKIAYTGRFKSSVRLQTDDGSLIHDYLRLGTTPEHEFMIPYEATKDGKVVFEWIGVEMERGVQVSEIWLMCHQAVE
jgi:hypothetical protein